MVMTIGDDFEFTELLPLGPDDDAYRLLTDRRRVDVRHPRGHVPQGRAGGDPAA